MSQDKIKAPHSGRFILFESHFLIPILIMGITAILFNRYDWDLMVQSYYYQDGWHQSNTWWVQLLYRHGNIPAIIVSGGSLLLLISSYFKKTRFIKYHKIALFLSIAMVLGPGIIVNSIFKDNWGRPRPRDLQLYGGRYAYEAPLTIDPESSGKSFPCGHATMGFYFYAVALVLGAKKKSLFYIISLFATVYGALIGWGRIIQGGHFLSDVIFAGAMVYLSTWFLWRLMKMHRDPLYTGRLNTLKLKAWHLALIIVGLLLLILGVSLATPYTTKQKFTDIPETTNSLTMQVQKANLSLSFSDSTFVSNDVYGFGFPGSRARLRQSMDEGKIGFDQAMKGFFTELIAEITVVIDTLKIQSMQINLQDGNLYLDLPPSQASHTKLSEEKGLATELSDLPSDTDHSYIIYAPNIIQNPSDK